MDEGSKLLVPNVINDKRTSMKDLPFLVLIKVFKKLSSKDRETCMKVCKQWEDLINWEVGLTCFIGKTKFILPGQKRASLFWQPFDVIGKRGIDKCIFGEVDKSIICNSDNQISRFLLPELVKEITFIGEIGHDLFVSIISPTSWLNALRIHLIAFLTIDFSNISLKLCSLSYLKVFYTHPEHNLLSPFGDTQQQPERSRVHKNLQMFLEKSQFLHLKIFEYLGPYFIENTECLISESLRKFAKNHENSLKELVVSFPYEWNLSFPTTRRNELPKQEKMNKEYYRRKYEDWGKMQLCRLVIMCPATVVPPIVEANAMISAWAEKRLNNVWKSLLFAQGQLKHLQYINKYEDWKFPTIIFSNSASHLTTISLSLNSKYDMDCKTLADCVNLSKLTLEGNFFHDFVTTTEEEGNAENEMGAGGELLNTHYLPNSLEEICLSKLLISTDEISPIANMNEPWHLPKLKSLQLYQISKSLSQFGLTPRAVRKLFDQPNLSISFWQAMNKSTFQNAIDRSSLESCSDPDVLVLMELLDFCQMQLEEEIQDLQFSGLNNCHIELIRKKYTK